MKWRYVRALIYIAVSSPLISVLIADLLIFCRTIPNDYSVEIIIVVVVDAKFLHFHKEKGDANFQ